MHGFYQRARIHLGITADNAEQWRRAAEGREPSEPDPYGSDGGAVPVETDRSSSRLAPRRLRAGSPWPST